MPFADALEGVGEVSVDRSNSNPVSRQLPSESSLTRSRPFCKLLRILALRRLFSGGSLPFGINHLRMHAKNRIHLLASLRLRSGGATLELAAS